MEEKNKSGLSTASMVLGIIAICLSFIPVINNAAFIMGVLSIIFGIIVICKKQSKRSRAITGLILGILAIIITLSLQAQWGKALNDIGNDLENDLNNVSGDNTHKLLGKEVEVTFGTFKVTNGEYFDSAKLVVTVKNKNSAKTSYSIQIEALDSNGNRLDTDYIYTDDLNSNQAQKFDTFTLISSDKYETFKKATFKVVSVSKM